MELEELKNVWASVDERLKENEMLKKRMIREMLSNKSNKSLNRMVNIEMFNIIVLLLLIPFCAWAYNGLHFRNMFSLTVILIFAIVISIFGIVLSCYTLKKYLLKIDFSKNIKDNINLVNKYNIFYRKGKMVNYFIIIPVVSLLCIWGYYELKVPFHLWILLFASLTVAVAITYWIYKKIYDANIQSIEKSLEELKELEEE